MKAQRMDIISHTLRKMEELFPALNLALELHEDMSKEDLDSPYTSAVIGDKIGVEIAARKGTDSNDIYIRLLILEGVNLELDSNFGLLIDCMFSSIMNYLREFCTLTEGVSDEDVIAELAMCCSKVLGDFFGDNNDRLEPSKVNDWVTAQVTTPKGAHQVVDPSVSKKPKDLLARAVDAMKKDTSTDKKGRFF